MEVQREMAVPESRSRYSLVYAALAVVLLGHMLVRPTAATSNSGGNNMETTKADGQRDYSQSSANSLYSARPQSLVGGGNGGGTLSANRRSMRSIYGLGPRMLQISRSKIPIELDLLVDNGDDGGERLAKRTFDDYGHMRFGKRGGEEQFDDYGHMRFGRSV